MSSTVKKEVISWVKTILLAMVLAGAVNSFLIVNAQVPTGSSAKLISRSVAKDNSRQLFRSKINGNAECYGHSECDAIIMDNGIVAAEPEITANHVDASLIHEAAIGKIAGDQLTKLMTLGLTEDEAEAQIINGFLK